MSSPQHFLVPIDFSPSADAALDYALALGQKLQARLTLLHVMHIMPLGASDMGAALPASYLEEVEADIRRSLEGYGQRVLAVGLEADILTIHGIPHEEILATARAQQVDLIIMGTHGRTGLGHLFLGSVAEKVVRMAPCPVLVVRSTPQGSQG